MNCKIEGKEYGWNQCKVFISNAEQMANVITEPQNRFERRNKKKKYNYERRNGKS